MKSWLVNIKIWLSQWIRRVDWYIIKKFLGTYFFAIALIISIAVVFDVNENIDKFINNKAPMEAIIFDYYLNFIPYFSNLFSPLFVFIAVIFFTSKLAENSEIIAMMSTGMSFKRLMRPYMISAAIIAALTYGLGAYVIPEGNVTRLDFEDKYRKKKKQDFVRNVQLEVDSGVIAYLGHMCNWEWIADIGNQFSDPTMVEYCVYRRQKSQRSDQAMMTLRHKRGGECIEKNILLRKLVQLRHASHPFVIGLIADQKPSPRNAHIWTTFLNQDTAFLDGGEVLAHKFGYAVLFAHITCPKRGYYRVRFEVITDDPNNMPEESITLTYAKLLEKNIREQPHMWLWTHNRWKWGRIDSLNNVNN